MRSLLLISAASAVLLVGCGGGGGGSGGSAGLTPPVTVSPPPPPAPPAATQLETKAEAADFLMTAGFAATDAEVNGTTGADAAAWVRTQLNAPPQSYLVTLGARFTEEEAKSRDNTALIWQQMIASDAQLRNRMTYALSQLFVINDRDNSTNGYALAAWMDILDRNAFGNYRDLMGDVTRSPMMGRFLTYIYNQKGNDKTGRKPDENYAREILQLFSIGLVELNNDGTVKLEGGEPVETFDNEDIVGLARVFTGYAPAGTSYKYRDRYDDWLRRPMIMWDEYHSELEKSFLGTTIPANTGGEESIDLALDAIFAHPNVPPFVARQLIQRFTASHPSPAYVERVATVFENGRFTAPDGSTFGTGQRGDLSATLAAIILDEAIHDDVKEPWEGKVREPVLKLVQFTRTYATDSSKALLTGKWNSLSDTSDPIKALGQAPLKSPSVFNFYRPGYIAPSTESGEAGYTAPELQIVNASSAFGYVNFMTNFIARFDDHWSGILVPDYTEEFLLADRPEDMINQIDLKLLSGRMSAETRAAILETVEALPLRDNTTENNERDRLSRVFLAMLMTVTSPEYAVLD